eukprot:scaffold97506_cov22-Tisochrysis_lutea.AAC.1
MHSVQKERAHHKSGFGGSRAEICGCPPKSTTGQKVFSVQILLCVAWWKGPQDEGIIQNARQGRRKCGCSPKRMNRQEGIPGADPVVCGLVAGHTQDEGAIQNARWGRGCHLEGYRTRHSNE